ncbi:hypothetical protein D9758_015600 [Tetrapyrgos nigripes]|uniref:Cupredoxin n=1 Tax=Tetrapyrgos nigripes TaxID=182062 RepID=A0A8H5CFN9_9AGAR|nr:hypothetical protein D9758_015600 [Tetrapyrgos nigripes]
MRFSTTRTLPIAALASSLATTALATNFDVAVGANGNLLFYPEYVIAQPGDTVNFVFHPKNHTVTQSTFDSPCSPADGGINSGFMPVAPDLEGGPLPNWSVTVNDSTTPIWIYCQQTQPKPHCGQGMVFAINPPPADSDKSFEAFKAKAVSTSGDSIVAPVPSAPPPQTWAPATATVTSSGSTWVTTYTSYEGTPQPTYPPQPVTHKIIVGDSSQLIYNPMNISASLGDTVVFEFHPKNHTVTQSTFNSPCQPKEGGFDSGFMPVSPNTTSGFPSFQITINDTAPIWGYCQQTQPASHCGAGMVFAINAVETGPNNFSAFQALAIAQNGPGSSNGSDASGNGNGTSGTSGTSGDGNGNSDGSTNGGVSIALSLRKGSAVLGAVVIVFAML